jgi:hypothetical protein
MLCPYCRKPVDVRKPGAGRKPTKRPCKFCGVEFGTVAMRAHVVGCRRALRIARDRGFASIGTEVGHQNAHRDMAVRPAEAE